MKGFAGLFLGCLLVGQSLSSASVGVAAASASAPSQPRVAILSYGRVGIGQGAVAPADFEREMLYLKESGTTVLSPEDYQAWRSGSKNLSGNCVLLSFSELAEDFQTYALPVLKRCGFSYMVMSEGVAALPGEVHSRVTDDASFAHAVNFGSSLADTAVLEDVKACSPAVEVVPQNVVLPEFSDDDVADDVSEEEMQALVADPAQPTPPVVTSTPVTNVVTQEPLPEEPAPLDPTPSDIVSPVVPEKPVVIPPVAEPVAEPEIQPVVQQTPAPAQQEEPLTTPSPVEKVTVESEPTEVPSPSASTEPEVGTATPEEASEPAATPVQPVCGVLGKRTPDGDWVTCQFKQPLVPREQTRVSVLGYHNFSKTKTRTEMRMSTADFCRQMQFLKDSDICVISMQDFLEWRFGERCLPAHCVLITIDDGWKSVYTDAYPILKAYGFPFTLYLYTRYINVQGDSMTSTQIKAMMANGATIGSHSSNHLYPSKWKRYKQDSPEYAAQLKKELLDSRELLVSMFGNCSTYCYPGGYNTTAMHATLEDSEYQAAFTVLEDKVGCEESPYEVHRYMVFGTNHEIFRRAVNFGGQGTVAATRAAIAAAEKNAREFYPAAFEGCTNRTELTTNGKPTAAAKTAAKKPAAKKTPAKPAAKPVAPPMVTDPALPLEEVAEQSRL